jgi:hypothetical protein
MEPAFTIAPRRGALAIRRTVETVWGPGDLDRGWRASIIRK